MTYVKRPGGPRWTKVVEVSGAARLCSTGTRDRVTADAIESWHQQIRRRGDPGGVLRAIVDQRITLAEAYSLDVAGTLEKLRGDAAPAAVDLLATHLAGYAAKLEKKRRAPKTVRQVRQQLTALYPAGVTAAMLTPTAVTARLEELQLTASTQNRYRAALSGFCRYLVTLGVLETNAIRDVESMPEKARDQWHTRAQLFAALKKCDTRTAAIVALMAGGGFEWCAIERLTPERIDLTGLGAHAEGGKRPWRNRHVRLRAWVAAFVRPVLDGAPAGERLFVTTNKRTAQRFQQACRDAKVPVLRLHDNRHTHAVHLLQDGESYKAVAHQLGHKTEALVISTYGMHAIEQQHYRVLGRELPKARPAASRRAKTTKAALAASSTNLSPAADTAGRSHASPPENSDAA